MKPTIKVSINGFAFNFDEDAYNELNKYLEALKSHFEEKEDGSEIILDIESRVCELLQMRLNLINNVVSLLDAEEVIKIMGAPKDFGSEEFFDGTELKKDQHSDSARKRLYRDPDSKIIGGICSGLGHYFNVDPVIVRVLLVALCFGLHFVSNRFVWLIVLAYLILWIAMPKAKTMFQKVAMRGSDPTIEGIENGSNRDVRTGFSLLGKILKVILGILLGVISLSLLLSLIVFVAVFLGSQFGSNSYITLNDILDIFAINTFDLKLSMAALVMLPIVGVLFFCLKLLFGKGIKSRDLIVSGLVFLLWIGSFVYVVTVGVVVARKYDTFAYAFEKINLQNSYDTFYIDIADEYKSAIRIKDQNTLCFLSGESYNSLFIMPLIVVESDSLGSEVSVVIEKKVFDQTRNMADDKSQKSQFSYILHDSLLVISPKLYNKNNIWDREFFKLIVTVPKNKTVQLSDFMLKADSFNDCRFCYQMKYDFMD